MTDIPPMPQKPGQPPALDYAKPPQSAGHNRWWKVMLRILGGIVAGLGSGALGYGLAVVTNQEILFLLPPLVVMGTFIFVAIKYRRFGYVTGFILAPLIAVVALVVMLFIICGNMGKP